MTRSESAEVQPCPPCFPAPTRAALGEAGVLSSLLHFLLWSLGRWVAPACGPGGQATCPAGGSGGAPLASHSHHTLFLSCLVLHLLPSLDGSASQAQHLPNSQVLWPDEAVCLRRKKRHSRPDPFARLSDLCHRQLPEDQKAILSSVEHDDPGHATLL